MATATLVLANYFGLSIDLLGWQMKLASSVFTDTRSLRSALKGLSSEDLLALNAEIEAIALERIEEEEAARVRAHERQQVIADIKELLALERINPEELLAFTRCPVSSSKRSLRCPDKIGQSRIKQPEQFSNTSC